jgi:sulfonate transport system permease protein
VSGRAATHHRILGLASLLGLVVLWQLLSIAFPTEILPGEPMVPGWQVVFTRTLVSLSDYWHGGFGVPTVADGAAPSYRLALLAIVSNSIDTLVRMYVGLALGAALGSALGLAVSWSNWSRRIVSLPMQVLRTLPLLAMVPLFQLWFGIAFAGQVIFVAYGVGVIFFAAVVNAVSNVPPIYVENARTFSDSKFVLYRTVILPAILPELRSAVLLALGTAWAAALGAEFLGAQSGLGYIIVYSEQFGYLDRMFLVTLIVILYASVSYVLFGKLFDHYTSWAPRAGRI